MDIKNIPKNHHEENHITPHAHEDFDRTKYIESLHEQPVGGSLKTKDYLILAFTGIVIPVGLFFWGYM